LSALVHLDKIEVLPVFKVIRDVGGVPEEDMINNLNIGVGMTMVVAPAQEKAMIEYLEDKGIHAYHIGEIIADDENTVHFSGKLNWGK
jgi:phosphoribosylformylglycinamidine cyclo-ligase